MAKKTIKHSQKARERHFRGGFTQVYTLDVLFSLAALAKAEDRKLKVHDLRVWAAKTLEQGSGDITFTPDWLINGDNPKRRMTRGEQAHSEEKLKDLTLRAGEKEQSKYFVKVPTKVLFLIARGKILPIRALFLLYYFSRRMPGKRQYKGFVKGEAYARIKYGEISSLLGYSRSRMVEVVKWLKSKLLLFIVSMHKQNENAFGQAFVDGKLFGKVRRAFEYKNLSSKVEKLNTKVKEKTTNPFKGEFQKEFQRMIARSAIEKQFGSS